MSGAINPDEFRDCVTEYPDYAIDIAVTCPECFLRFRFASNTDVAVTACPCCDAPVELGGKS